MRLGTAAKGRPDLANARSGCPPGANDRSTGFALILVLWITAALALVSVALLRESREDLRSARGIIEDAKAQALADAGIYRAMLAMANPDRSAEWQADGSPHELALGEGVIRVRIEDDSGKIDLNRADELTLRQMLRSVGADRGTAEKLAASIADYRNPGNAVRAGGDQSVDYEAAGLPHGPKGAPFDSPEELLQVPGMTREIMRAVSPLVTVYSPSRDVNAAVASTAVLLALPSMDRGRVAQILAARAKGVIVSQPLVVTITAEAATRAGDSFIREATLRRTSFATQPFEFLAWRRVWPADSVSAASQ